MQIKHVLKLTLGALLLALTMLILPQPIHTVSANTGIPLPASKPALLRGQDSIPAPAHKPNIFRESALEVRQIPLPSPKPVFAKFYSGMTPDHDAELYKKIFSLQKAGKMKQADKQIAKLNGKLLMGHILYQRYMHPTAYSSSYNELHKWMENYADLPQAKNIHALAKKRRLSSEKRTLHTPIKHKFIAPMREPTMVPGKNYKHSKTLTPAQITQIEIYEAKANIAARAYYNGDFNEAYRLSAAIHKKAGAYIPKASWIYGLTSWRKNKFRHAAQAFGVVADSPYASGWEAAGGAYWAARSYIRAGQKKHVREWLGKAAAHPRTFYGLIATRALGKGFKFNWNTPSYSKADYKLIAKTSAGERAIALVNAGQIALAEQELKYVDARKSTKLQQAILAYAEHTGMPGISMRLGSIVRDKNGAHYDGALYPKGPWKIQNKGSVNKELVHALIRQESRFDPIAKSYSGAAGLMQIMPATAAYVTNQPIYKTEAGRILLEQPKRNLEIGSKYLKDLSNMGSVGGSLFNLLIAYNGGPGNLAKWQREANLKDQLLFIESIPSAESRVYVERVLSNYWIYRLKAGKDTRTLDAIALGKTPKVGKSFKLAKTNQ